MNDKVEEISGNLLQHGHHNDRIYLMRCAKDISCNFPMELIKMAKKYGYSKIFAKVPETQLAKYIAAGYSEEARVPQLYSGKEAVIFLGFYLDKKRMVEPNIKVIEDVYKNAIIKQEQKTADTELPGNFKIRECVLTDIQDMAQIYKNIFPSYPFPIQHPDYLQNTMQDHVNYFCVETNGELAAICSAEIDHEHGCAEMTDFATPHKWRGHNLSYHLLRFMGCAMEQKSIHTTYTIARAVSYGMNITFSRCGYKFGGRLINNTNISGQIESMNVWYLARPERAV